MIPIKITFILGPAKVETHTYTFSKMLKNELVISFVAATTTAHLNKDASQWKVSNTGLQKIEAVARPRRRASKQKNIIQKTLEKVHFALLSMLCVPI